MLNAVVIRGCATRGVVNVQALREGVGGWMGDRSR